MLYSVKTVHFWQLSIADDTFAVVANTCKIRSLQATSQTWNFDRFMVTEPHKSISQKVLNILQALPDFMNYRLFINTCSVLYSSRKLHMYAFNRHTKWKSHPCTKAVPFHLPQLISKWPMSQHYDLTGCIVHGLVIIKWFMPQQNDLTFVV